MLKGLSYISTISLNYYFTNQIIRMRRRNAHQNAERYLTILATIFGPQG